MTTKWIVGVLVGAAACVSSSDVVTRSTLDDDAANGAIEVSDFLVEGFELLPENDECYDFVGKVVSEEGNFIGSCVLIDPNVALTAAHCMIPNGDSKPSKVRFGDNEVKVKGIFFCPMMKTKPWNPFVGSHIVGDLAILELAEDVPTTTLPIINTNPFHVNTYDEVRMVGFGGSIKKMTKPDWLYSSGITMDSPENIPIYPHFAKVWYGDSGGGLFSDDGELSGIIYRLVISNESEKLVEFTAVNIGYYSHWIELTRDAIREMNR
jgi:V8-like Glu-specific endopeptidase